MPTTCYPAPTHGSANGVDFAALSPSIMVRVGSGGTGVSPVGASTSSGSSWWAGPEPSGITGGGTVPLGADGSRTVWSPDGAGVNVSTTFGSSSTASAGVPAGARVDSDRANRLKFYAFSAGTLYVSTNGGASFTPSAATGFPTTGNVRFGAVHGLEGDVWLADGSPTGIYGMWHATNSGATFTKIAAGHEGDDVGFGKAAPSKTYPVVYQSSKINGVRGIFRSEYACATWVRINNDEHQWAWTGETIPSDPDVYGCVCVSTNGRGIVVGNVTGRVPTPTPTPTATATPKRHRHRHPQAQAQVRRSTRPTTGARASPPQSGSPTRARPRCRARSSRSRPS